MKLPSLLLLSVAALPLAGGMQYSSVSEKRPAYRYKPITSIDALIVNSQAIEEVRRILKKSANAH